MARTKYSTEFKKLIIKSFQNGLSQKEICEKFSLPKQSVSFIIRTFKTSGRLETVHSGGRPRCTTTKDDSRIVREVKKHPQKSAVDIVNALNLKISSRTVQRRACDAGLKSYRAAKKPFISNKNRLARIKFAKEHINWSVNKWKTVLFSDESKFNLKHSDGNIRIRRPVNNRLNPLYCKGTVKHGGGSVMVWGCFSGSGVGPLYKINGIMDRFMYKDILENTMLPYAEWNMPLSWQFQQDNDPKHTAKCVKEWFRTQKINVMEWPAQSPDLNPIENLWEIVNKRIDRDGIGGDKNKLFEAISVAWKNIDSKIIDNLIASMPKRCKAVLENKGFSTKY